MNVLLVMKEQSNSSWSSSLQYLAEEFKNKELDVYYVGGIYSDIDISVYDKIIINHSYCFYKFLLKFGFNKKIIFIPHEGEPFLGWYHAIKQKQLNRFGAYLRYSKLYNLIPYYLSSETILLSNLQRNLYKKGKVINLLGVNEDIFKPEKIKKTHDIFFPSKRTSPEKGFHKIICLSRRYSILFPDNTPNNEMVKMYNQSKVILIPSVFETYGLVVIEAMLTNSVIIVSENIGIIHDLLKKFSKEELSNKGIFIFSMNDNIKDYVEKAMNFYAESISDSRNLALDFGLSYKKTSQRLIDYVR
ncbi:glycosyltransferase [Aliivibrio fischeri]|uniref:glycosyltransferase n=1 Tax=Aliivibrio fischeri TaxID=668 RepID=UPI0012D8E37B|nr:glycosyltransferase [Aliivibrio fischeri]MUJ21750.1 glycosyltransferase [Aliivibrio fischeri]